MSKMINTPIVKISIFLCLLLSQQAVYSGQLPDRLAAAILIKIIEFEKNLRLKQAVNVHVISNENIYKYLKQYEGSKVGLGVIESVTFGKKISSNSIDVVFVGNMIDISGVISQTRENKIISMSSETRLSAEGVTVVIFDDEGVPGILLNTVSSKLEGASWDPEILEVADVVEDFD